MCKITELMAKFQILVNELFQAQVAKVERKGAASGEKLEEKLTLLLLLSVITLLIVIISRAQSV